MFFLFPKQYWKEELNQLLQQLDLLTLDIEWICFNKTSIEYKFIDKNSKQINKINLKDIEEFELKVDNLEFETFNIAVKNKTVSIQKEVESSIPYVFLQDIEELQQVPVDTHILELLEMIFGELNFTLCIINDVLRIDTNEEEVNIPLPQKDFDIKVDKSYYRYKKLYHEFDLYKVEVETIL